MGISFAMQMTDLIKSVNSIVTAIDIKIIKQKTECL